MQLRISYLVGTDLAAVCLWPEPGEPMQPRARGLPTTARCVETVTADVVEALGADPRAVDTRRIGRSPRQLLHALVDRAERLRDRHAP